MAIREAVGKSQEALKTDQSDEIRASHQELAEAAQAIADALYSGAMDGADELADELYEDEEDFAEEAF